MCHEHGEYDALRQVDWMIRRAGLRIVDVALNGSNGGSFAVTVAKTHGAAVPTKSAAIDGLLANEVAFGLDTPRPFEEFWSRVLKTRHDLFRDAIIAREAEFRARGGKLVFPLPNLDIVE